ncbi:MAG TPA: 3-phosphoshikimate 1-carboxyvinyltransferase [Erysipelotrichaceae bacterium]|nr:3-phosphoshikimate 1-carboxyvinyltransferase [Erysipelotrichaceae bacterium]
MDVKIYPSKISGRVKVPSSKSVVHRALIASSLSSKESIISNVDFNEDIYATIAALKVLGAKITTSDNTIEVIGLNLNNKLDVVEIDANESGSTLRFIIPLASYLANKVIISGSERLMERPLNIYQDLYIDEGLIFKDGAKKEIIGSLSGGHYQIDGSVSSQFLSGLMFLLPIIVQDSKIEVLPPFESKPYVDLTIETLKKYNINITSKGDTYFIKGGQSYLPYNLSAEGDYSQAAFFAVLGAINNEVVIENLNLDSVQGDRAILAMLLSLNVKIEELDKAVKVYKSNISSKTIDLANTPDLGPILCVLGLFSEAYIKLINVKRLRIKESDRLLAIKSQLEKIGAKVILEENSITIFKLDKFLDKEIVVSGENDHRIVMAMAIAATSLKAPLIINGADAINKSYPNFFNDLSNLGVKVEYL